MDPKMQMLRIWEYATYPSVDLGEIRPPNHAKNMLIRPTHGHWGRFGLIGEISPSFVTTSAGGARGAN